jgi:hypothetical protein
VITQFRQSADTETEHNLIFANVFERVKTGKTFYLRTMTRKKWLRGQGKLSRPTHLYSLKRSSFYFLSFLFFSFFLIFSADRGKTSFLPFNESLKSHLIFEIFVTYKYWTEIFFRNYGAYFFNIP